MDPEDDGGPSGGGGGEVSVGIDALTTITTTHHYRKESQQQERDILPEEDELLQAAVEGDMWKLGPLLHDGGVDVNAACRSGDYKGWRALHRAADEGHAAAVLMLLNAEADPGARIGEKGPMAAHLAAQGGHLKVLEELLPRMTQRDKFATTRSTGDANHPPPGMQLIHLAALGGHEDVLSYLTNQGFDVNALTQDDRLQTALHLACENHNEAAARWLVTEAKCDITKEDHRGYRASDLAEESGNKTLCQFLKEAQMAQLLVRRPELAEDAAWRKRGSHTGNGRQKDQPTGQINQPVRMNNQPVGLRNLGNTCYLNAVVQCLYHTDKLTAFFLDDAWRSHKTKGSSGGEPHGGSCSSEQDDKRNYGAHGSSTTNGEDHGCATNSEDGSSATNSEDPTTNSDDCSSATTGEDPTTNSEDGSSATNSEDGSSATNSEDGSSATNSEDGSSATNSEDGSSATNSEDCSRATTGGDPTTNSEDCSRATTGGDPTTNSEDCSSATTGGDPTTNSEDPTTNSEGHGSSDGGVGDCHGSRSDNEGEDDGSQRGGGAGEGGSHGGGGEQGGGSLGEGQHHGSSCGPDYHGEVAESFCALVLALRRRGDPQEALLRFKRTIGRYDSTFVGTNQQEAHDLLSFLLDALDRDLQGGPGPWRPAEMFSGLHLSKIICPTTGKVISEVEEPFTSLSLPVVRRHNGDMDLDECLERFYRKQKLLWDCPECPEAHECENVTVIMRLPPVLVIHLSRVVDSPQDKYKETVLFPRKLSEMNQYAITEAQRGGYYQLCAACYHHGTTLGGHYTATCRAPDEDQEAWNLFDDDHVTRQHTGPAFNEAHILFYQSV